MKCLVRLPCLLLKVEDIREKAEECHLIDMLLTLSFVVQNHAFPHTCGTQIAGTFTTADTLQAEVANQNSEVDS